MTSELIHDNLIFLIGSPRSGSTLLQRMIGSHSEIYTHPEPHLITPLYYLGYYATVDASPYDHVNAAQALRELCEELPHGEQDYLDAVRSYASTLYGRVLAPTGKRFFLDKTPAYGLVLPFLAKLYPRAKYVVLTRHPLAITHSVAHSFFGGDYQAAEQTNPIARRYVPAIAELIREKAVDMVQVRYDDLVSDPETQMKRILDHLGLPFEEATVEYGQKKHISKSYGDPMSVEKHSRPVTSSLDKWAADLLANPETMQIAKEIIEQLDGDDLALWGYPKEHIFDALEGKEAVATKAGGLNTYRLKRQVLLRLRRNIHSNQFGAMVKKVRYYCDVLLRS